MAFESNILIVNPEDSPTPAILSPESIVIEENRMLRLCVLEMLDAWSNGKESPSAIPGFP